jgi:hypothetical protein
MAPGYLRGPPGPTPRSRQRVYSQRRRSIRHGLPARQPRTSDQGPLEGTPPEDVRPAPARGELEESVYAAQELTGETLYRLEIEEKLPYDQAWELVREEWAFLPSEEDQPNLPFNPAKLSSRLSPVANPQQT